jgi:hypothetical protein
MSWRSVAAAAFVLAAACGPTAAPVEPLQPEDFTLRGVPLDADSAEIRLTFGDPDSTAESPNPFDSSPLVAWIYDGFEVRFAGTPLPAGYMIVAPGESTPRGASVGDPSRLLLDLYGEPVARVGNAWTWADTVGGQGLRVIDAMIEADTIRRIYIGRASN